MEVEADEVGGGACPQPSWNGEGKNSEVRGLGFHPSYASLMVYSG